MLGAGPLPTIYSAPAGARIAGPPDWRVPYDTVLPNGRIVDPAGASVVVGMNALGVALTPDGRYAIVSNNDEREAAANSSIAANVRGGYSLSVVDTSSMRVTDVYARPGVPFFLGVAAIDDPANPRSTLVLASGGPSDSVRAFTLDSIGRLAEERVLPIPTAQDARYANASHAFPASIAVAPNGRVAYVVNNVANSVTAIDLATRRVMNTVPVGYFPYAAVATANRLYVTDSGLMNYARLSSPAAAPAFAPMAPAPSSASALSAIDVLPNGDVGPPAAAVSMDRTPDGVQNVGGAHPEAIAASRGNRYAYVCMTNVDRLAVVDLAAAKVIGGIPLQLFDGAPFGTQPDAIVRSPDGKRLYVALAGINAVAVIDAGDPAHLHRLGLIPTGWYPSALAVSPSGRYLYVANAKGIGSEPSSALDSNGIWSTLQRIDLHRYSLRRATLAALRNTRTARRAAWNSVVPPLRSSQRSSAIRHVIVIEVENKTYDAMLGDLTDDSGRPYGNGDPAYVTFGANITPNLHALARRYALATNFYADAEESDAGHQFATAGIATAYTEKTALVKRGRFTWTGANQDPEDYPRAGYIFNAVARAGMTYRDYGELLSVTGYDAQPKPLQGLGGLFSLDIPAPSVLGGHVDLDYATWNPAVSNVQRAREFIRDYTALEQRAAVPDVSYIWLPNDREATTQAAADDDRALGMVVDFLSHQPSWSSTAVFITGDDAQSSRDHINAHRTYAVVVSPYAKRQYTGSSHLSTVSILKTEEELLGLPPLSLGDLLATDMSDFFTASPDLTAYVAAP